MAEFRITGPDGQNYKITAPDDADENSVLDFFQRSMRRPEQAPEPEAPKPAPRAGLPAIPPRPSLSVGETIADVGKSAGIGLAQGGIGLVTLPGNLEMLGRMGIDKATTMLGGDDPGYDNRTYLPTYSDAKSAIETKTGEFYKPKSVAGDYARTIGEFAPLAVMGPGGAAARAVNVAAPAIASETAGQMTAGTEWEPWARAGAGLAGGMLPNAAMRVATPLRQDPTRVAQVQTLQNEGIDALTAGQQTGNRAVRWAESAANDMPFNGGRGLAMNENAAEQFTAAALRRAGVNSNRATQDVMDGAFTNLGQQFDDLAARNTLQTDNQLLTNLRQAWDDYSSIVPESQRAPAVENILRDIWAPLTRQGSLPGAAYQPLRSRLNKMSRDARMTDPPLSRALGDIMEALDDAMTRSAPAADAAQWGRIRGEYRNLIAVENAMAGAGEATASGLISPSQLRTAVKNQNKRAYVRGQGDLAQLANAGEAIMKPLPQSGTAPRMAFQNIVSGMGTAAGAMSGGPPGAVVGAFAPAVAQGGVARALMSRPVQRYMSNRALEQPIEAYAQTRLPASRRVPQAATDIERGGPTLSGGIGPRYDDNGNERQAGVKPVLDILGADAITERNIKAATDAARDLVANGQSKYAISNQIFEAVRTAKLTNQQKTALTRVANTILHGSSKTNGAGK